MVLSHYQWSPTIRRSPWTKCDSHGWSPRTMHGCHAWSRGPSTALSITTVGPPPPDHSLAWLLQQLNIHDVVCACPHYVKLSREHTPRLEQPSYSGLFSLGTSFPEWTHNSGKIYFGIVLCKARCKVQSVAIQVVGGAWRDHNISLILTCCIIQCRTLLSSRTLSLQLQLLMLKLQLASYCECYEWFQHSN